MTLTAEEAIVETESEDDPDITHYVCHCTKDKISWCKMDVSMFPMSDDISGEEVMCPLCVLVSEQLLGVQCPWGCRCVEDCGPDNYDNFFNRFGVNLSSWQQAYINAIWPSTKKDGG